MAYDTLETKFNVLKKVAILLGSPRFAHVIDTAMANKGYIAGGFARLLYSLHNEDTIELQTQVENYLGSRVELRDDQYGKPAEYSKGDVDIYFPNERRLLNFWADLRDDGPDCKRYASLTGNATNIMCDGSIKVQIMHEWTGNYGTILNGFDLTNSKIAYFWDDSNHDGTFIYDERLPELERTKTLNADVLHSVYTVKRLMNYSFKWKYKQFTPETKKLIVDDAPRLISSLKKEPLFDKSGMAPKITALTAVKKYYMIKEFLDADDIVFLSSLFAEFGYQHMLNHLNERADKGIAII